MTCGISPFRKHGAHDSVRKRLENMWSVLLYSCLDVRVFTEKAVAAIPLFTITGKEGQQSNTLHFVNIVIHTVI